MSSKDQIDKSAVNPKVFSGRRMISANSDMKVSMKGLAGFMTGSATKQRKIVTDYKYPTNDEARSKIFYYAEARGRITKYHREKKGLGWLLDQADNLDFKALGVKTGRRSRLRENARAIRSYGSAFSGKEYGVLNKVVLSLQLGDVRISVVPDLHVLDGGKEKLIKLDFSKDECDTDHIKIINQIMLMSCEQSELKFQPKDLEFIDIEQGVVTHSHKLSKIRRDIESSCQNFRDIWAAV